jgi:release factor glutamine methyltransferase
MRVQTDLELGQRAESAGALRRSVAALLRSARFEAPEREARRVLETALGAAGAGSLIAEERRLEASEIESVRRVLARRLAHEPLSRIAGAREFYGRAFKITPATLDPRPETETLIDAAKEIAALEGWQEKPITIIDIGTGSGCLLLTLLAEFPEARGLGTDVSAEALAVAAENARRLALDDRARFEVRRSLAGLEGSFDIAVSNPPYVPTGDIAGLAPEVRNFDPWLALDGGEDGLDAYREIVPELPRCTPNGWSILEVGAGQAAAVCKMLGHPGVGADDRYIKTWRDLGGHVRCVAARPQS